jgi:hypothetical protein
MGAAPAWRSRSRRWKGTGRRRRQGDVAAIESLTSDDYTLINANGQLSDKAKTMNDIRRASSSSRQRGLGPQGPRLRRYGRGDGKSSAKGTIGGRELTAGDVHPRLREEGGKWQSVAFQQTPIAAP